MGVNEGEGRLLSGDFSFLLFALLRNSDILL